MPKSRKQYSPSEKAAILREHLIDRFDPGKPMSTIPPTLMIWGETLSASTDRKIAYTYNNVGLKTYRRDFHKTPDLFIWE